MTAEAREAAGQPPEGALPEGEAQPGAPTEGELLLGKFKTQDDLVNAYRELEGRSTQQSQREQRLKGELAGYGLEYADDGRLAPAMEYAPDPAAAQPQPPAAQPEPTFEEQWTQMQARVERAESMAAAAARTVTETPRTQFIAQLPEGLRERGAAMWQDAINRVPPDQLVRPGTLQAVSDMAYGRLMRESMAAGNLPQGSQPNSAVTQFSPSERPSGEGPPTPRRAAGAAAEAKAGLRQVLANMGPEYAMTDEEWAAQEAALRQDKAASEEES